MTLCSCLPTLGGAKGKGLLDTLTQTGANVVRCPKITRFADRLDFVRQEFRRAAAARAMAAYVRFSTRSARIFVTSLLRAANWHGDTTGMVDESVVATYYRGRAEATGFSVADQAVEGRLGAALEQLRWALAVGVSPVLITSALAQGVRSLAKVGSAPRGRGGAALASELGMPPWKVDRVRQQLRGWTPAGVARALQRSRGCGRRGQGRRDEPGLRARAGHHQYRDGPLGRLNHPLA